jgi:hypothetical protein
MRRVAFAALLGALLAAHPATAGEPRVVGRGELVAGRDLASWEVAWTRWIFRFPRRMVNSAGGCLPQPDGPVRFLSGRGSADDHVVSVDCTVPADRYLLLGTPLALCSDVVMPPGYPRTTAGLKRCAREFWAQVADPSPRIVLDGAPLPNGFVVHTPVFRFTIPAHDNAFNAATACARPSHLDPGHSLPDHAQLGGGLQPDRHLGKLLDTLRRNAGV